MTSKQTFRILSLDGGGMRGIMSARILQEVETVIQDTHKQPLHEYFDLIAGTSTGSILAAGLACGLGTKQLIDFYEEEGENIFPASIRWQRRWRLLGRIRGQALYPHERGKQGLAQVLKRKLVNPDTKEPVTVKEVKVPNLLILAYDVLSRNTTWFSNDNGETQQWYADLGLWQVCTASASAPTFFPPYELPYNSDQVLPHIDGGVAANSPELAAIAHALILKQGEPEFSFQDISVLSIGTGRTTTPFSYQQIKGWGLLDWVKNLSNIFIDPPGEIAVAAARQILESTQPGHYLRLNFDLNQRLKGERIPGRLRPLGEPYNIYLKEKTNGEEIELKEDIDDPSLCGPLTEAAEAYLDYGRVAYGGHPQPIRDAIKAYIATI